MQFTAMEEEISQLNELLKSSREAALGYQTASEQVDSEQLQKMLLNYGKQRQDFAYNLEQQIRILGGRPTGIKSSISAGAHRIWINLKGSVGQEDHSILQECLRGEQEALKYYETILDETTFSNDTRLLLAHQMQKIKDANKELERMIKN